ncbi:MAG: DUF3630 family protein [Gammaproteobacteria bacterium]|nr:DUF3630 family protein [Gammaproteobacteria bacterium]
MTNNYLPSKLNFTIANVNWQQGYLPLNLSTSWDNFPIDAKELAKHLGATIVSQEVGADLYHWTLDFEGTRLNLIYEDNSESCWLELHHSHEQEVLDFIATLIGNQT